MSGLDSPLRLQARLRWRLALVVASIALTALALSGTVESLQSGAMMMLPALVLAVVLLLRPYLGERTMMRLHARRARRPGVAAPLVVSLRSRVQVARGGRLIAAALAGRAPPLAFAGCR
jgi:hypothetical protein